MASWGPLGVRGAPKSRDISSRAARPLGGLPGWSLGAPWGVRGAPKSPAPGLHSLRLGRPEGAEA
eukprot:15234280-Alexandrium_andersonii.AAC.1